MSNHRRSLLLFDATNIIHRTFSARESANAKRAMYTKHTSTGLDNDVDVNAEDVQLAGLAHYTALVTINKYFRLYQPDKVILTFDRSNWRKDYTRSSDCISKAVYKGNRRQNMTPKEQETFARFCDHITEFEQLMRDYTGMVVLAGDGLEADDLIAGVAQMFHETDDIIIVSADKDLMQLLRYPSVCLINPADGNARSLVEYNMSADYFIFQKCIRGDRGDNVKAAFPKVRATRIQKAFEDPYERTKLMNEEWTDQDNNKFIVGDLYKENKLLMDLSCQPEHIRQTIVDTINEGFENPGTYDHFKFVKFCGKYGLRKIVESLPVYQKLLV